MFGISRARNVRAIELPLICRRWNSFRHNEEFYLLSRIDGLRDWLGRDDRLPIGTQIRREAVVQGSGLGHYPNSRQKVAQHDENCRIALPRQPNTRAFTKTARAMTKLC